MVLGKLDIYIFFKVGLNTDLTSVTKMNSKWITDLTVKCKIIKLLEDTIENLDDFGYGDVFLETTSKA